jgi:site-specific recombinase XerD
MTALRQRMLEDMSIRNLAENTQLSYVQQVAAFARCFRSPDELGPEEVRAYQVHLIEDRKLAPSSVGIATSALRFLYHVTLRRDWTPDDIPMPKKRFRLPVVLSPEEVVHFLESVDNFKHRTIFTAAYAAGLRISEATRICECATSTASA